MKGPALYSIEHPKEETPEPEVAKDPTRLALWQKGQDGRRKSANEHTVIEARGCGHQALFTCGRTSRGSTRSVFCSEHKYPPGMAAW